MRKVFLIIFICALVASFQNCSPVRFITANCQQNPSACLADKPGDVDDPNGNGGNGGDTDGDGDVDEDDSNTPTQNTIKKTLSFGLLTRNMACVMCHTTVVGDVSGFGTMTFRSDSSGTIFGNIYAADQKLQHWIVDATTNKYILNQNIVDTVSDPLLIAEALPSLINFNLDRDSSGAYSVKKGERHNIMGNVKFQGGSLYSLTMNDPAKREIAKANIVKNPFIDESIIEDADFPKLNPSQCSNQVSGYIQTSDGQKHFSPVNGNAVFMNGQRILNVPINTPANAFNGYDVTCPTAKTLEVHGEVVINGDMILAGCVRGQGTIYVDGDLYLPDDIKVVNSAFPFVTGASEDILKMDIAAKSDRDMLSLGTTGFVMLGSFSNTVIMTHEEQDPIFRNNLAKIENVYTWLTPGTPQDGKSVYERAFLKRSFWKDSQGKLGGVGAIALVDANLYANMGIALSLVYRSDSNRRSNFVMNGSIATPNLQMLVPGVDTERLDQNGQKISVNPFNQKTFSTAGATFINQDFRLKYSKAGFECHRTR